MKELPKDYPLKTNDRELKNIINELTEKVVSSTGAGLLKDSGAMSLLKLGKLQLGINELQSRQAKRVMRFTIFTAAISVLISLTALFISIGNNSNNSVLESEKLNLQKETLLEIKSINESLTPKVDTSVVNSSKGTSSRIDSKNAIN